jgi:hypothetical protein
MGLLELYSFAFSSLLTIRFSEVSCRRCRVCGPVERERTLPEPLGTVNAFFLARSHFFPNLRINC